MVCNYTHHFMYVILITYIISGMLVLVFTQLWSSHVTFLCAYANFITYFCMQSSEKMRTHCCVHQGLLICGLSQVCPKIIPNPSGLKRICVLVMKEIIGQNQCNQITIFKIIVFSQFFVFQKEYVRCCIDVKQIVYLGISNVLYNSMWLMKHCLLPSGL